MKDSIIIIRDIYKPVSESERRATLGKSIAKLIKGIRENPDITDEAKMK